MGFSDVRLAAARRSHGGGGRRAQRLSLGCPAPCTSASIHARPNSRLRQPPIMYSTYEKPMAAQARLARRTPQTRRSHHPRRRARTGSGRESSSIIAVCHAAISLCRRRAMKPSWSTATRKPFRPTTTLPTGLYFEPLTPEDVLAIIENRSLQRHAAGRDRSVRRPDAAQARASASRGANVPILGTSPDAIDLAEDRDRFKALLEKLRSITARKSASPIR